MALYNRKSDDERKDDRLFVRVSKEQKAKLLEYAKVAGVSLSAYIVGSLLGDSIGKAIVKKQK